MTAEIVKPEIKFTYCIVSTLTVFLSLPCLCM